MMRLKIRSGCACRRSSSCRGLGPPFICVLRRLPCSHTSRTLPRPYPSGTRGQATCPARHPSRNRRGLPWLRKAPARVTLRHVRTRSCPARIGYTRCGYFPLCIDTFWTTPQHASKIISKFIYMLSKCLSMFICYTYILSHVT